MKAVFIFRHRMSQLALFCTLLLATCVSVSTTHATFMLGRAPIPAEPGAEVDGEFTGHLRVQLMSFADSFAGAIDENMIALEARQEDSTRWLSASRHRAMGMRSLYQIAAGEYLDHALLNMAVVTTLTRRSWQDYWQPEVYGDSASGFVHELDQLEARIWRIVGRAMTAEQVAELRALLDAWYKENQQQKMAYHIRFSDLIETGHIEALAPARKPGGLFGLKGAMNEMDEMRQTLERTLWLLPRMQGLAGLQAQNLLMTVLAEPEMQTMIGATNSFASTGESLAGTASRIADSIDRLPADVAAERQAVLDAIEGGDARRALGDVRGIVDASNELAAQIDATMHLVDAITQRMAALDPEAERIGPAEIQALTAELGAAAGQLESLVVSINEMMESSWWDERLPQLIDTINHASDEGKKIIDHSVWRASALIAIFMAMLLATMLTFRLIVRRFPDPARGERAHIDQDEQR